MGAVEDDVLALVDVDVKRGGAAQSGAEEVEVAAALVLRALREEGAIDVALIVVHCAAPAVSAQRLFW